MKNSFFNNSNDGFSKLYLTPIESNTMNFETSGRLKMKSSTYLRAGLKTAYQKS